MLEMTAAQIADVVGGTLVAGATGDERIHGNATVDSRAVQEGDLFVAFVGERVDGHDFLRPAHEAGATLALVTREDSPMPAILVADAQEALTALARHQLALARSRPEVPVVIALTGSSGKTSTKDLLASILGPLGHTIAPAGSRNNELGLPLTVLELTESTRFLVLEMGARGIGHIDFLTSIARPDIAIVLNVGSAHVGEFGTVENIQRAKTELVTALGETGVAVLNADDPRVRAMAESTRGRVTFVSTAPPGPQGAPELQDEAGARDQGEGTSWVWASEVRLTDAATASFTLHLAGSSVPVTLALTGEHHVSNALAAASAAHAAGIDVQDIVRGLQAATTRSPGRMQLTELPDGITLINDAYNANPESMRVALKALAHLGRTRRTVAVLGEMLELGEGAVRSHDEVGRLAVRLNIAQLIVVGPGARAIHNGASLEGSFGGESRYVETIDEARTVLEQTTHPGDVILFKSSNGARLAALGERIADEWTTQKERA